MHYTHEQKMDIMRQCRTAFGLGYYACIYWNGNSPATPAYIEALAAREYPDPKRVRPRIVSIPGMEFRVEPGTELMTPPTLQSRVVPMNSYDGDGTDWARVGNVPGNLVAALAFLLANPTEEYE